VWKRSKAAASGEPESALADLQRWYASNCDGTWEEELGIEISTIADPGWRVSIDLTGTNLDGVSHPGFERSTDDDDWIACRVENQTFIGCGGPTKLDEILAHFVSWAKASTADWLQPPPPLSAAQQQEDDDRAFWASLGDEGGPELCTTDGCPRRHISLSVKCRAHHFEMVKRRAPP
jgi:hypothetical protein